MARAHYNPKNPKHRRYVKERARGRTQREAGKRAGYSRRRAAQTGNDLETDPATLMAIKEELRKDMDEGEIRNRLAAMSRGHIPSKVVRGEGSREEYDGKGATESAAKILGMFVDKHSLEIASDRESALKEIQDLLKAFGVTATPEQIAAKLELEAAPGA